MYYNTKVTLSQDVDNEMTLFLTSNTLKTPWYVKFRIYVLMSLLGLSWVQRIVLASKYHDVFFTLKKVIIS